MAHQTSLCVKAPGVIPGAIHGAPKAAGFNPLRRAWHMYMAWRTRRHLVELPDHLLYDLGLREWDREAEISRRFWDLPRSWR
jgi:uncharacterized protein YjiS (DUF1127 family)